MNRRRLFQLPAGAVVGCSSLPALQEDKNPWQRIRFVVELG
ncbi:MAG: hypothetical protein WD572_10515 [Gammaproteobacteria bacterium]